MKGKFPYAASAFLAALLMAGTPTFAAQGTSDSKDSATSAEVPGQMELQQMQGASGQTQAASGQSSRMQVQTSNDLKNYSLKDNQGQSIGNVEDVVIDLNQGQVGYLVVSTQDGNTLVIPWKAVKVSPEQQSVELSVDQGQLNQAPQTQAQQLSDQQQGQKIHQFYGVSPYWQQSGQSGQSQQDSSEQLPAGHPPVEEGNLPAGHPPVFQGELPPGHPPVNDQGGAMDEKSQE